MNPVGPSEPSALASLPQGGLAVVIGASGGLGAALAQQLAASGRFARIMKFSRQGEQSLDLAREDSIAAAAREAGGSGLPLRLVIVASGFLHDKDFRPEKSTQELDPAHLARAFAINAIGPALAMKHFLPRLPREQKSAFIALSARVGSIGDNRLGGWHSYRASKAALNQLVHTAAVELKRSRPEAVLCALHPGTVATSLSAPFAKAGLEVQTPAAAAQRLCQVIDQLNSKDSGGFFDHRGETIIW